MVGIERFELSSLLTPSQTQLDQAALYPDNFLWESIFNIHTFSSNARFPLLNIPFFLNKISGNSPEIVEFRET